MKKVYSSINEYGTYYFIEETSFLHREDGPAVELSNGDKFWCKNNQYHRVDGPACLFANGNKEYYLNGIWLENVTTDEELIIKLLLE